MLLEAELIQDEDGKYRTFRLHIFKYTIDLKKHEAWALWRMLKDNADDLYMDEEELLKGERIWGVDEIP